jgi:hypothetical protein
MGIGSDTIGLLTWLKTGGYLPESPATIEIGAQQLANSFLRAESDIAELGRLFGRDLPFQVPRTSPTRILHGDAEHLDSAAPFARDFWLWLGFEYASIDIDGSPGSIPLDLNFDNIPNNAAAKYHLVTNFGTTEHVANQLNAFKVIHELAAPNGVMVHHLPAQGMFNHGLVNYNPKFFWMLARSNGYKVLDFNFTVSQTSYRLPQNILDYMTSFSTDRSDRIKGYQGVDAMVIVVLQKIYDIAFVAPIDVTTGTTTDNQALKERYWTVFKPNVFENLPRHEHSEARHRPPLYRLRRALRRTLRSLQS